MKIVSVPKKVMPVFSWETYHSSEITVLSKFNSKHVQGELYEMIKPTSIIHVYEVSENDTRNLIKKCEEVSARTNKNTHLEEFNFFFSNGRSEEEIRQQYIKEATGMINIFKNILLKHDFENNHLYIDTAEEPDPLEIKGEIIDYTKLSQKLNGGNLK